MTPLTIRIGLVISLLLWVGTCIGANMIAAPAKFQVMDLTLPIALQVGRAQFHWVGYLEYTLAGLAVLCAITAPRPLQLILGIAVFIFLSQRLLVLPLLSVQTDLVIAGQRGGGSHLHIYFIACELLKIIAILAGAIAALRTMTLTVERV